MSSWVEFELDSSPDTRRSRRNRPWRLLSAFAIVSFLLVTASMVSVSQEECRIDPVTGSVTRTVVWLFGITSGPHRVVSPLETRLLDSEIGWSPSLSFLHRTHRNAFGKAFRFQCGSAPPIYRLKPLFEEFAAEVTNAQLREFVQVMQFGTDDEREAAVGRALQAL